MKKRVRTIGLFATLTLVSVTSSSALWPGWYPDDCYYECYNSTTGQFTSMKTKTSSYSACCESTNFACPAGSEFAGSDFWVSPQDGGQYCR